MDVQQEFGEDTTESSPETPCSDALRLKWLVAEQRQQLRAALSCPSCSSPCTQPEKQSSSCLGQPSRVTLLEALQKTRSLPCPCPLWGCPQSKHPAEMEESHGKQDSCQEGQDHLGHLLKREDPSAASHAGAREGQGQSQLAIRSSEALKPSLHSCIPQKRNAPSASTARCLAPKFQPAQVLYIRISCLCLL